MLLYTEILQSGFSCNVFASFSFATQVWVIQHCCLEDVVGRNMEKDN